MCYHQVPPLARVAAHVGDAGPAKPHLEHNPLSLLGACHTTPIRKLNDPDEVRRLLTDTEAANGFGNRFLWVCVRRSKLLPDGGRYPHEALTPLQEQLTLAIQHARTV